MAKKRKQKETKAAKRIQISRIFVSFVAFCKKSPKEISTEGSKDHEGFFAEAEI